MPGPRAPKMGKPKDIKKTIKRILSYMKKYRALLVIVFLCVIITSASNIYISLSIKPILNEAVVPLVKQETKDFSRLYELVIMAGIVAAIGAICNYIYVRIMVTVSSGTLKDIRSDMVRHMEKLPIKYFDTHTHGEVMSYYTNDVDALREMISQGIVEVFSLGLLVVGAFISMLVLSPVLTIFIVLILIIMLNTVKFLASKSGKYFKNQQLMIGKVNGYIEEMMSGAKVVKVFNREKRICHDFDKLNEELAETATKAHIYSNILMPIMANISNISIVVIGVIAGVLGINGYMDIGTIGSYLQFIKSFTRPITQISQQFSAVLSALAGAERIFKMLDTKLEVDEGYVTLVNIEKVGDKIIERDYPTNMWSWKHPHGNGTVTYTELKGEVEFENVTFGYDDKKVVLNNISLNAKAGEKIAFVGSTGAGKTTITNLINRFYDIQKGKIRYDGINIKKIKKDDLRRSLSMVLQDTHLFTGTIKDNIKYGKLNATDDEVLKAAKLANADSFISHLKDGYDTMITSDGHNLSEGQRQLLSIARAAIANPPVLILDEATSSIDTRTESLIEKGMDELMKGRTVFVIAHRLSTIRNADDIKVLEHGEIIEEGNHDQLIAKEGKYYKLYKGLFELD